MKTSRIQRSTSVQIKCERLIKAPSLWFGLCWNPFVLKCQVSLSSFRTKTRVSARPWRNKVNLKSPTQNLSLKKALSTHQSATKKLSDPTLRNLLRLWVLVSQWRLQLGVILRKLSSLWGPLYLVARGGITREVNTWHSSFKMGMICNKSRKTNL